MLYGEYKRLYDHFGRGANQVMPWIVGGRLRQTERQLRTPASEEELRLLRADRGALDRARRRRFDLAPLVRPLDDGVDRGGEGAPFFVSAYSTRTGVSGITVRSTIPSSSSSCSRSLSMRSVISGIASRSTAKRHRDFSSTKMIAPVQRRPMSSLARWNLRAKCRRVRMSASYDTQNSANTDGSQATT